MIIAICDDWPHICSGIKNTLLGHPKASEFAIYEYFSGEALCSALEEGIGFDLIILDIQLPGLSGVQVGQYLRDTLANRLTQVLYISTEQGYAMDLFAIQPLDFLLKPIMDKELYANIDKALLKISQDGPYISFTSNKVFYRLRQHDVRYFESDRKTMIVHAVQNDYAYSGKMSELGELQGFVMIHQSFLVNYHYIRQQRHDSLLLDNGVELPISRPYRQQLREFLLRENG